MSWHLIEKILDEVSKQSTFVGKVWITLLFVFRIIAVTRIGDTVYADEQAAFKCNSRQPGCENVCFNKFSPISHMRFWGFQIIMVATPAMLFMVYAAHIVSRLPGSCRLSGRHIDQGVVKKRRKRGLALAGKKSNSGTFGNGGNETILSSTKFSKTSTNVTSKGQSVTILSSRDPTFKKTKDKPPNYEQHKYDRVSRTPATSHVNSKSPRSSRGVNFDHMERKSNDPNGDEMFKPRLHDRYSSEGDLRFHGPSTRRRCVDTSSETGRQYKVAEECYVDDILEPSFVWELDQRKKIAVTLMHLRTTSDSDSAFSENTSSLGRPSPRRFNDKVWGNTPTPALIKIPQSLRGSSFSGAGRPAMSQLNGDFEDSDRFRQIGKQSVSSSRKPSCLRDLRSTSTCTGSRQRTCIWRAERKIAIAYFVHCVLRMATESFFLVMQYKYFNFVVPELYKCSQWPCPNTVDCFISRPQEKSTMLVFMFAVTAFCIVLTCIEIIKLIARRYQSVRTILSDKRDISTPGIANTSKRATLHQLFDSHHPDHCNVLRRTMSLSGSSSSSSSSSNTSSSDASAMAEASFNSEELSDMLDEAVEPVGDYNEQAEANDYV